MEIAAQRIFLRSLGGAHLIDPVGYATSGPKNLSLEARASQMMSFGSDSLLKLRIVDVPYLRMLGVKYFYFKHQNRVNKINFPDVNRGTTN